ncbi:hypothetical protein BX285_5366 [Streptomyces sp. 1114.5]|uniref:hypothetical protein n=1 Tax=Streptomyces sp. 1114.5 TaxID=1938830 RepID=UPI000F0D8A1A|nr:hypothetical protein [Streptomyces sp. 1114.5]RKT11417.1 hypothetical protein BX285_5366 [Streptomyces sp. 1114.5]
MNKRRAPRRTVDAATAEKRQRELKAHLKKLLGDPRNRAILDLDAARTRARSKGSGTVGHHVWDDLT